jgi:uridine monophosphate synthetase
MGESGDEQGQQWRPPHQAIVVDRNDIVIVGRGVTQAADPVGQVLKYQHAAWSALQERDKE